MLKYRYSLTAEYNGPLEAAHACIDDDRYDMMQYGVASQPTLDLSDYLNLRSLSIFPIFAIFDIAIADDFR